MSVQSDRPLDTLPAVMAYVEVLHAAQRDRAGQRLALLPSAKSQALRDKYGEALKQLGSTDSLPRNAQVSAGIRPSAGQRG